MGRNRNWIAKEDEYLTENWGSVSIDSICKHLKRSRNAINVRVQRLGLPPFLECGEYVTMNQLLIALGYSGSGGAYYLKSWSENRDLPIHTQRRGSSVTRVVYIDEFWDWAYKNRSFVDFSRMEPFALGKEPEWVNEQRRKDIKSYALQRKDPWTPEEDSKLIYYLKQHKYGYHELSKKLRRSAGAIQRRCLDLSLKERPIKADNHGTESTWTDDHYKMLADGIKNGDSYMLIADSLGRSEKAVRGKVYFVYLTENLDKVRAMLGSGNWGDGAPEPTVRQAVTLSRTRSETKYMLEQLCGVLYRRTLELKKGDYDNYFMRAQCMNWNPLDSVCIAGCDDCDCCSEFRRITPQYCVRCGSTFYERTENKYCEPCRRARKKQAQRKWAALNSKRK